MRSSNGSHQAEVASRGSRMVGSRSSKHSGSNSTHNQKFIRTDRLKALNYHTNAEDDAGRKLDRGIQKQVRSISQRIRDL